MAMQSKSTPVTRDYIAHTEQHSAVNVFEDKRIKSLRLINTLSYALTTLISLGSIHTSVNDEYDDYENWTTNQTLLSVAPYTQYIWYFIFILQGLFIAASYLPSLWSSELLGYNVLAARAGYKHSLPVVHYPALCASTLMMMYSTKLNIMSLAFLGSCASTYFLVSIIKYQSDNARTSSDEDMLGEVTKWFQRRNQPASTLQLDDVTSPDANDVLKHRIQQYFFLLLPFELYAGYNLALNLQLFNIITHKLIGSAMFNLILASVSLLFLLGVGCYVTWTEKKGLCYGIGTGLAWFLVSVCNKKNVAATSFCISLTQLFFMLLHSQFGVFFQLIYPSAPISLAYSDGAINAAKYMAVVYANVILSTIAIRAAKNIINVNVVSDGENEDEEEEEDDVSAEYVHA
eukprot:scaffold4158_cov127-Skeletonema_menzelii.AAC.4